MLYDPSLLTHIMLYKLFYPNSLRLSISFFYLICGIVDEFRGGDELEILDQYVGFPILFLDEFRWGMSWSFWDQHVCLAMA